MLVISCLGVENNERDFHLFGHLLARSTNFENSECRHDSIKLFYFCNHFRHQIKGNFGLVNDSWL